MDSSFLDLTPRLGRMPMPHLGLPRPLFKVDTLKTTLFPNCSDFTDFKLCFLTRFLVLMAC